MKIHLAPHELEPERLTNCDEEPFTFWAQWFGQEREFVGQVVGQKSKDMIFFALADEPERGNFVSAQRWSPTQTRPISEPRTLYRSRSPQTVLESSMEEEWGRLYFLDEELNVNSDNPIKWRLFLTMNGWGEWAAAPDFYQYRALFRWQCDKEEAQHLICLPPLELLKQVRPSLLDSNSDAAFARWFAPLGKIERHQACLPPQQGTYDEWNEVLILFLQSRSQEWNGVVRRHRLEMKVSPGALSVDIPSCFNERFPLFCDWTKRYFVPTIDFDLLNRCVAAQWWSRRRFAFWVRVPPMSTQHERMEAMLQLREWLEGKAAPDQIAALLDEE